MKETDWAYLVARIGTAYRVLADVVTEKCPAERLTDELSDLHADVRTMDGIPSSVSDDIIEAILALRSTPDPVDGGIEASERLLEARRRLHPTSWHLT